MTTSLPTVVVLGGGYAGALAAIRAAKLGRDTVRVLLVNRTEQLVERVRLHETAATGTPYQHSLRELTERFGVQVLVGNVRSIAREQKQLLFDDGTLLSYDRLVLAVGSATDLDRVPGVREHALSLVPERMTEVHNTLAAARTVVVAGMGATGVELAAELAEHFRPQGMRVHLLGKTLLEQQGPSAREAAREALEALGVLVHENCVVTEVGPRSLESSEGTIAFDACVWTAGFRAPALLQSMGLRVDAQGRALVDATMCSIDDPCVFVAGDAACVLGAQGTPLAMGCKTAMPMGVVAGEAAVASLLGREAAPLDFRDTGYCVSVGRKDGLIFVCDREAAPQLYLRYRTAAWVKSAIVGWTTQSIRLERWPGMGYRWFHHGKTPPTLSATSLAIPALQGGSSSVIF